MKKDLYFGGKDEEICYPISYWEQIMAIEGWDELTLYKAKPQDADDGFFWCHFFEKVGEKSEGSCGKVCSAYQARNGKKGCCKHYSVKFFEPTNEIKVIRKRLCAKQ